MQGHFMFIYMQYFTSIAVFGKHTVAFGTDTEVKKSNFRK